MSRDPFQPGAHTIVRWDAEREAHLVEHVSSHERYWVDLGPGHGGPALTGRIAMIPNAHRIYHDLYVSKQHRLSTERPRGRRRPPPITPRGSSRPRRHS